MFQTIGIGVTFSPNLTSNLFEAARLALMFESSLILIHVGPSSEEKIKKFQSILAPFVSQGLVYTTVFQPGDPVRSILKTVEEESIDLLILGALQRENFLKYYVGSIARKITRKVSCSLLLLIKPSEDRIPCEHIVVNGLLDDRTEHTINAAFAVGAALGSDKLTIVE
ncbi:MAG: universal stress protein, partial [Flavobacteriaceae bacterium]|nr:universal stress protein [Flavobacteriaceae bacterium]